MQQHSEARKTLHMSHGYLCFQIKLKWPIVRTDSSQCLLFPGSLETNSWEYTQSAEDINDGVRGYN